MKYVPNKIVHFTWVTLIAYNLHNFSILNSAQIIIIVKLIIKIHF